MDFPIPDLQHPFLRLLALDAVYEPLTQLNTASRKLWRRWRFGRNRTSSAASLLPRPKLDLPQIEDLTDFEIEHRFGLSRNTFSRLLNEVAPCIEEELQKVRYFGLTSDHLFCICLEYLRIYEPYWLIGRKYGLSQGSISKILNACLPILRQSISSTNGWFTEDHYRTSYVSPELEQTVVGCVDATFISRHRVHPGQALLYRGDKRRHGLSVQLVCTPTGEIINVQVFQGHNNDQGIFTRGGVPIGPDGEEGSMLDFLDELAEVDAGIAADGGYPLLTPGLINPQSCPHDSDGTAEERLMHHHWNGELNSTRVIVENVFSRSEDWGIMKQTNRHDPSFQAMCIIIVFWLINEDLKERPLRDPRRRSIRW